jgi:aminoglycoside phosphotransferase (APT) family kinase protein
MFPLLGRYLLDNWTEVLPGTSSPDRLSFVQLPGSRVSTFLILGGKRDVGHRRPLLAVKIPRSRAGDDYLRLEYQNLERLAARWGHLPGFLKAIPKPISLCAIGGKTVLLLEGIPGSRLHTFPTRGLRALARVCEWLAALQAATRTQVALSAEDVEAMFLEPIRKFAKGAELSSEARAYLRRLEDHARSLSGAGFPLVLTHGDFSVSNILLDDRADGAWDDATVSVIDWTKSLDAGLPVRDLWHLLTAYAKGFTPEASSGRITWCLRGSGSYGRTVRRWLDDYCEQLSLPRWMQGLGIAFEYIYGALDHPWGIETTRRARYQDNFEAFVHGIGSNDEDRPFALLAD